MTTCPAPPPSFSAAPALALKVAVLVDLPRSDLSGGHVKGWETLARAAAAIPDLDLTVYFSGHEKTETLCPTVRLRQLPPVFSTARLKALLPYLPDNTDLAPFHPRLARELLAYDVLHTTDGYFAFARTAEIISRKHGIPLITSFHTDTPGYARVFTRRTIETLVGQGALSRFLTDGLALPDKQKKKMEKRMEEHLRLCQAAIASRPEDKALAARLVGAPRVGTLRHGADYDRLGPHRRDRAGVEKDYAIPPGRFLVLFVGRLDEGKNIYTLIGAVEHLIAKGAPVHLLAAGVGPAESALRTRLCGHVSAPGFVAPDELARLYASADVMAIPSEVELRSLAAGEAMASGLPVLISEKSGVAGLLGFPGGMQVVTGGAKSWAEAIEALHHAPDERAHMAEAAHAFARAHFPSWEDILREDFVAIWKGAINDRR